MRVAAALLIILIAIILPILLILPATAQGNGNMAEEPVPGSQQGAGTITGIVLSSVDSHAIPEALVTLLDMDGNIVPVPENPQLTSSGIGNNAGIYTFFEVPYGTYNVTAMKGDVSFFAVVDVGPGTVTANIVLPGYVETTPAYQPPLEATPMPKPFVDFVPVRVGKAAVATQPDEGMPIGLAVAGGIGALLLFGRRKSEE